MGSLPLILDSIILRFGEKDLLHGVYIGLEKGRFYGLYGLNGSGKTSLMKIVMGLLTPASGTVFIGGIPYQAPLKRERFAKIGYLPQESFVPTDIGIRRLVGQFPDSLHSLLDGKPFVDYVQKKVSALSSGLRRYLEIRMILSLDRPIILLDEPFTGLEPMLIERVIQDLRAARDSGRTILLTDHYYQYVSEAVDERFLLSEGRCQPLNPADDARSMMLRTSSVV
jgi:lipopolysaccharide export system ATP-binding protein